MPACRSWTKRRRVQFLDVHESSTLESIEEKSSGDQAVLTEEECKLLWYSAKELNRIGLQIKLQYQHRSRISSNRGHNIDSEDCCLRGVSMLVSRKRRENTKKYVNAVLNKFSNIQDRINWNHNEELASFCKAESKRSRDYALCVGRSDGLEALHIFEEQFDLQDGTVAKFKNSIECTSRKVLIEQPIERPQAGVSSNKSYDAMATSSVVPETKSRSNSLSSISSNVAPSIKRVGEDVAPRIPFRRSSLTMVGTVSKAA